MTDNEILARWQGWKTTKDGRQTISIPLDYPNDDAAAMSLLDTLVEKGMMPVLRIVDTNTRLWRVAIYDNYCDNQLVEITGKQTRREAVVAACLEVARKEDV